MRIVVGLLAGIKALRLLRSFGLTLPPSEVLRAPYLEALPLIEPKYVLGAVFVAAVLFTVGLLTRVSGSALAIVMGYWLMMDRQLYLNHLYLLFLLVVLLVVSDSGRAYSIDALRRGRGSVPYWGVTLIKLQLSMVYAFAALAKLNPDFLHGEVLVGQLPVDPGKARMLAVATILVEAWLAIGLWLPRFLWPTIVLGVLFHLGTALSIAPMIDLLIFGGLSVAPYLLFLAYREPPIGHGTEPALMRT